MTAEIDLINCGVTNKSTKFTDRVPKDKQENLKGARQLNQIQRLNEEKDLQVRKVQMEKLLKTFNLTTDGSKTGKSSSPKEGTGRKTSPPGENFSDGGITTVRCFICPTTAKPHEFYKCKTAMSVGNKKRSDLSWRYKLCVACLCKDCKSGQAKSSVYHCGNNKFWIACRDCMSEDKASGNNRFGKKPKNALICNKHVNTLNPVHIEKRLKALGWTGPDAPVYTFMMGHTMPRTKRQKRVHLLPEMGNDSKEVCA
jgi:hypothetical protein